MTGPSRGARSSLTVLDETADWVRANPGILAGVIAPDAVRRALEHEQRMANLAVRRAGLIAAIAVHYGVTVYPHPRDARIVVVSEPDYLHLVDLIAHDPLLNAVGRGYYSWLGGELIVQLAPAWACDPTRVALARLYASAVVPWARPIVRALTRLLSPHTPKGTTHG